MRRIKIIPVLAAGMAAAILAAGAAQANQIPGQVVTGYVSSIQGDSITVDGQTYTVAPGSPAADELASLSSGQKVDVQLNGPASSSDSQVVNVVVHQGQ
jgi:hypothetical protein